MSLLWEDEMLTIPTLQINLFNSAHIFSCHKYRQLRYDFCLPYNAKALMCKISFIFAAKHILGNRIIFHIESTTYVHSLFSSGLSMMEKSQMFFFFFCWVLYISGPQLGGGRSILFFILCYLFNKCTVNCLISEQLDIFCWVATWHPV